MSVTLDLSGAIHHMVAICGTQVENNNISRVFFYFFNILFFLVVGRVKGQKMVHNDKKPCLLQFISQES